MASNSKGDDLVKFITQQVVTYIETPREVRKLSNKQNKEHKEPWQTLWFGMLPFAIHLWIEQRKKNKTPPNV